MTEFHRFALRTTYPTAARTFYREVLGHDRTSVWPLHEQALARGARPHWLGHLRVPDVERTAAAFVARGAARLGPSVPTADGGEAVVLRDPGGAVVALSTPAASGRPGARCGLSCAQYDRHHAGRGQLSRDLGVGVR